MNEEYLNSIDNYLENSINELTQQYKQHQSELQSLKDNEGKDDADFQIEIFANKQKIQGQQIEIDNLRKQIEEKKRKNNVQSSNENQSNFLVYFNILNCYFGHQILIQPINAVSEIQPDWLNDYKYANAIILFETDENKVFGLFMGWYFVVIENNRLFNIYGSTGNTLNITDPQFYQNRHAVVNNAMYIFGNSIVLGDIENAVESKWKNEFRKLLTNKPIGNNVVLPVKNFYFYQAQIKPQ